LQSSTETQKFCSIRHDVTERTQASFSEHRTVGSLSDNKVHKREPSSQKLEVWAENFRKRSRPLGFGLFFWTLFLFFPPGLNLK
jgi:hypothetical protein